MDSRLRGNDEYPMTDLQKILSAKAPITLAGAPAGFLPWLLADLARAAGRAASGRAVFIAADGGGFRGAGILAKQIKGGVPISPKIPISIDATYVERGR